MNKASSADNKNIGTTLAETWVEDSGPKNISGTGILLIYPGGPGLGMLQVQEASIEASMQIKEHLSER